MALGYVTKVEADGSSAGSPEALNGAGGLLRSATNIFEPNVALTGKLKYVQLGLVALVANAFGYRAATNQWGVGVSPSVQYVLSRP